MRKLTSIPLATTIILSLSSTPILAQKPISQYFGPATNLPKPTDEGILATFFQPIISFVPVATGLAAFVAIILAGIKYITHAGNPAETKKASDMLTYALVGLGISALAFALTRLLFRAGGAGGLF